MQHIPGKPKRVTQEASVEAPGSDEEVDEDEQDKLVLPEQRISLALMPAWARQVVWVGFAIAVFRVLKGIGQARSGAL